MQTVKYTPRYLLETHCRREVYCYFSIYLNKIIEMYAILKFKMLNLNTCRNRHRTDSERSTAQLFIFIYSLTYYARMYSRFQDSFLSFRKQISLSFPNLQFVRFAVCGKRRCVINRSYLRNILANLTSLSMIRNE